MKKTRADIVFSGILCKNDLARMIRKGTLPKEVTVELNMIEKALEVGMKALGLRDSQPSVNEIVYSERGDI